MGNTSNASKTKWNAGHYAQIKVSIKPEVANAFRSTCEAAGVSMASKISQYMAEYGGLSPEPSHRQGKQKPSAGNVGTRLQRRNAIKSILKQMERIKEAEERYCSNVPENLQGSDAYESAEQSISVMEDAIELLRSMY